MNHRMRVVALFVFVLTVAGCRSELASLSEAEQRSSSDAFIIPEKEQAIVEANATKGDLASIRKLIAHYDALSGSEKLAARWKAVARERGDSQQLNYYAASMLAAARSEQDPAKRSAMLVDALSSAQRSNASNANPSAQKLILEASRAMDVQ